MRLFRNTPHLLPHQLQTSDFILYINLILSLTLEYFYPTNIPIGYRLVFGIVILIISWFVIILSKIEFKKYQQKSGPSNDITNIINTRIYRYSRNQIYLATILINISIGFIFNSIWILVDTIIIGICLNYFLI
jgi:protein-S-isoprenylcysteine O-methyltransferase Ste14